MLWCDMNAPMLRTEGQTRRSMSRGGDRRGVAYLVVALKYWILRGTDKRMYSCKTYFRGIHQAFTMIPEGCTMALSFVSTSYLFATDRQSHSGALFLQIKELACAFNAHCRQPEETSMRFVANGSDTGSATSSLITHSCPTC